MTDLLLARGAARGGVITATDVRDLAITSRALRRLLVRDELVRVGPRAYVLTGHLDGDRVHDHALRARAVACSFEGRVAVSHQSAAALHGLPLWGTDLDHVHVCRVAGTASRRREGLVVHRAYPGGGLGQFPLGPTRAVVLALAVLGTAMLHGAQAGVVSGDAALRLGGTTLPDLEHWLQVVRHHPGAAAAGRAVNLMDARSESVGESRTRFALAGIPGLPEVTPQHPFADSHGVVWARADFLIGAHLVLEFDGRLKYRAAEGPTQRAAEEIVWAEKRREDRIRGEDKVVERLVWADLERRGGVAEIVRRGLNRVRALGL